MPLENEDRPSDSPYVHRAWRSRASGVARMTSIAPSHWELVFWEHKGRTHATVRGPETTASSVEVPDGSQSFGIIFAHGASMPHLPPARLVDSALNSPHATATAFVLRGQPAGLLRPAAPGPLAHPLHRPDRSGPAPAGRPLSLLYKIGDIAGS